MSEKRTYKLPLLGQMVNHVRGLLAEPGQPPHKKPHSSQKIAHAIGTSSSNWTNIQKGDRPISVDALGKLVKHFGLHLCGFDHNIFLRPTMEEFTALLSAAGVGRGGQHEAYDEARRTIIGAGQWKFDTQEGLHVKKVRLRTRGGLGAPRTSVSGTRLLSDKDAIVIEIHHPENGHLVLLNDDVALNEVTCLAPSLYAPTFEVKGRLTCIPTKDGAVPAIQVNGSVSSAVERRYCLYALWSAVAPNHLDFVRRASANIGVPATLSIGEFQEFAGYVRQHEPSATRRNNVRLLVADYYVAPSSFAK